MSNLSKDIPMSVRRKVIFLYENSEISRQEIADKFALKVKQVAGIITGHKRRNGLLIFKRPEKEPEHYSDGDLTGAKADAKLEQLPFAMNYSNGSHEEKHYQAGEGI